MIDQDRTLEELEGDTWGRPPFSSYVVTTCHEIRRKPLREITDEELRLAIGQDMGSRFLLPLAIERLSSNPLASGDFYEGALLHNVLRATRASTLEPEQVLALDSVVQRFGELAPQLEPSRREECLPAIEESLENYRQLRQSQRSA